MTAVEMKKEFLARYDAATSLAAPGWEDSEISDFLNIAQDRIIKEAYSNSRLDLIFNIVVDSDLLDGDSTPELVSDVTLKTSYTVNLTEISDFLYYVSSRSFVNNNSFVYNEEIDMRQAAQFIASGSNRPFFRVPKCFISFDKLRIIISTLAHPAATPVGKVIITYVKIPAAINITTPVNCELNEALHKDIVEYAVQVAIQSIKIAKIANQE